MILNLGEIHFHIVFKTLNLGEVVFHVVFIILNLGYCFHEIKSSDLHLSE